ncbi:MAG: FtsW/RodA/SpoVE family cell cycle protein, partial [Parvularculaceae bacterium]|nr:FtsW/RodA/SpoVE family cell cycle protein [Parvularculaceae bacterium]
MDNSAAARWWWSVDHVSLGILAALTTIGVILIMAAGPGAAARLGIDDSFHFPIRQLVFLIPAAAVVLGVSTLTPLQARRLGSGAFVLAVVLAIGALLFAPEINGAKR